MASSRLTSLRALFSNSELVGPKSIDFYVLPRTDYHNSEYIADHDERVKFLSGFSGSNAFTIIGKEQAYLWTDGRYFDQASKELTGGWQLMKEGNQGVPSSTDWLLSQVSAKSVVGIDPHLFGYEAAVELITKLKASRATTVSITKNLVDEIWKDRPHPEVKKLISLTKDEVGADIWTKIKRVRETYAKKKCDSIIIGDLAEIAWLFNLRGADIPFNPVFFSIAFLTNDSAHLFLDERKLSHEVINHLKDVKVHPYESIISWLKDFHHSAKKSNPDHKVWITNSTNYAWGNLIAEENAYVEVSPIQLMKAVKSEAELSGMRNSHIRDAGALIQFFYWLEKEIHKGHSVTEKQAADKILEFRSKVSGFVSESFPAISAVGKHAALPHYHMTEESGKVKIDVNDVFLLDSGAQYRDGTTDVTRTVVLGTPSDYVKRKFTLVFKGHVSNAMQTFPDGINSTRLDALSRQFLWDCGLDYGHGVGHGVGHFLNVHEFPPSIGYRFVNSQNALKKGMVVTIEPGYYETDNFGIRIENAFEVVEKKELESKATNFVTFRSLTWVPYQKSLIVKELLSDKEIKSINAYHRACLEKTGAYLKEQRLNDEYEYLKKACEPL